MSNAKAGPVSGAKTGSHPLAGSHAQPHIQQPFAMKENKTNTPAKGEICFGVAPSGVRGGNKGAH